MRVQKHYKKCFTKEIVSKGFYKEIDKKPKTRWYLLWYLFIGTISCKLDTAGTCCCTVHHSKDLTESEKNACKLLTVRSIFFESRTDFFLDLFITFLGVSR
jgi:hypothetical protein